jgi:transposase
MGLNSPSSAPSPRPTPTHAWTGRRASQVADLPDERFLQPRHVGLVETDHAGHAVFPIRPCVFTTAGVVKPDVERHHVEPVQRVLARRARTDKAYRGDLDDELAETLGVQLEIPESESDTPGFAVEPKRWIIERIFGWFGGWRRLSKEYERLSETSEAIIRLASLQLALNRLQ